MNVLSLSWEPSLFFLYQGINTKFPDFVPVWCSRLSQKISKLYFHKNIEMFLFSLKKLKTKLIEMKNLPTKANRRKKQIFMSAMLLYSTTSRPQEQRQLWGRLDLTFSFYTFRSKRQTDKWTETITHVRAPTKPHFLSYSVSLAHTHTTHTHILRHTHIHTQKTQTQLSLSVFLSDGEFWKKAIEKSCPETEQDLRSVVR